nr:hypothetical protein CFP56_68171 [Quercus suber]
MGKPCDATRIASPYTVEGIFKQNSDVVRGGASRCCVVSAPPHPRQARVGAKQEGEKDQNRTGQDWLPTSMRYDEHRATKGEYPKIPSAIYRTLVSGSIRAAKPQASAHMELHVDVLYAVRRSG